MDQSRDSVSTSSSTSSELGDGSPNTSTEDSGDSEANKNKADLSAPEVEELGESTQQDDGNEGEGTGEGDDPGQDGGASPNGKGSKKKEFHVSRSATHDVASPVNHFEQSSTSSPSPLSSSSSESVGTIDTYVTGETKIDSKAINEANNKEPKKDQDEVFEPSRECNANESMLRRRVFKQLGSRRKPDAPPVENKKKPEDVSPPVESKKKPEGVPPPPVERKHAAPPPNVPQDVRRSRYSRICCCSRSCCCRCCCCFILMMIVAGLAIAAVQFYLPELMEPPPAEPLKVNELSVQQLNEHKFNSQLTILVVGKYGIGKRTLVSELFGEGQECSNNTKVSSSSTMCDIFKINGVSIQVLIMDSPDLRLHGLRSIDLVMFMTRLDDAYYRVEDKEILVALTQISGLPLWKRGMTVLTFANKVTYVDRDTGVERQSKKYLMERTMYWERNIHDTLRGEGVSMSVLSDMPTVPVGHPSKVQLFDNMESWKTSLIKCMLVRLKVSGMEASAALWRVMKDNIQFEKNKSTIVCE